ncbi:MarR family winged helix-turn-helix transcriptional regulator [Companilactobacillus nantensis]|uniref:Transcriptional regulator n=1 Tax=Companilactobacillus nantensis DSM 16982 TaxID=1423774 RepID=A0A0R1WLB7_9LACO|nr:MarR family transcriptional regulator [Companilactobacillus nantensis]KRM14988.1 transcriptional regulator [Companilactobacillus nantensis DSM 16982]GEO64943.1 MarR family transcriptional regulator [Companilactobacillus nantensis]
MPNLLKQKNTAGKLIEFGMVRHVADKVAHRNSDEDEKFMFQGQGKILLALSQNNGLSQKELATRLDLTAQSTAEFVNKLVKKGFVTKEKSTTDRRMTIIRITDLGRQTTTMESSVPEFLNALSDEELDQFANILTKINTHLYAEIDNADHQNIFSKSKQMIKDGIRDWFL